MTSKMSASLEDPGERLKELSLILQGPYKGHQYSREDCKDRLGAIFSPLDKAMLAIGPLNRNQEWYVTMHNHEAKDELLTRGTITVKGECFKVKPADRRHYVARVHWAPVFLLNSDIYTALRPFAEVRAMKHDMYVDAGLEEVATGVTTVVLYGDISNNPRHPSFISFHCVETGVGRPRRMSLAPASSLRH